MKKRHSKNQNSVAKQILGWLIFRDLIQQGIKYTHFQTKYIHLSEGTVFLDNEEL